MNELKLPKEMYSLKTIQIACKAYSGIANIHLDSSGLYWICTFGSCEYEVKETILEFENYLIDLENSCHAFGD